MENDLQKAKQYFSDQNYSQMIKGPSKLKRPSQNENSIKQHAYSNVEQVKQTSILDLDENYKVAALSSRGGTQSTLKSRIGMGLKSKIGGGPMTARDAPVEERKELLDQSFTSSVYSQQRRQRILEKEGQVQSQLNKLKSSGIMQSIMSIKSISSVQLRPQKSIPINRSSEPQKPLVSRQEQIIPKSVQKPADQDISQDQIDSNDPDLIFGGSNEDLIEDDEFLEFSRAPQDDIDDDDFLEFSKAPEDDVFEEPNDIKEQIQQTIEVCQERISNLSTIVREIDPFEQQDNPFEQAQELKKKPVNPIQNFTQQAKKSGKTKKRPSLLKNKTVQSGILIEKIDKLDNTQKASKLKPILHKHPTQEANTVKVKTLQKSEILRMQRMNSTQSQQDFNFKFHIKEAQYKQIKGISLKKRVNFKKQEEINLIEIDSEQTVPDTRVDCQFCGRLFWPGQHVKHQKICNRVFMTRRTLFGCQNIEEQKIIAGATQKLNENWRLQQKTFRAAIKAAKEGNLLSDGTIDDRVSCQYCGRKFRAEVAIRHLPLCQKKADEKKRARKR